jgi:hypothetical protein
MHIDIYSRFILLMLLTLAEEETSQPNPSLASSTRAFSSEIPNTLKPISLLSRLN